MLPEKKRTKSLMPDAYDQWPPNEPTLKETAAAKRIFVSHVITNMEELIGGNDGQTVSQIPDMRGIVARLSALVDLHQEELDERLEFTVDDFRDDFSIILYPSVTMQTNVTQLNSVSTRTYHETEVIRPRLVANALNSLPDNLDLGVLAAHFVHSQDIGRVDEMDPDDRARIEQLFWDIVSRNCTPPTVF